MGFSFGNNIIRYIVKNVKPINIWFRIYTQAVKISLFYEDIPLCNINPDNK